MKKNSKNKSILVLIDIILVLLLCIILLTFLKNLGNTANEVDEVIDEEPIVEVIEESLFTKDEFDEFYELNHDYIGHIIFKSGIIKEPIVYSNINSYYLRKNLNKEYSIQGTVYLDERNEMDDQNLILYGHFTEPGFTDYEGYDPDIRPMFTNLDLLLDEENYEENKTVYLYLKNEEIKYEIVSVYYCPLLLDEETNEYVYVSDGYEYYLTNYSDEEFNKYKNNISTKQRYAIDLDYDNNDYFLTLQTCVAGRSDLREIVLLKEISRSIYQ